MITLRPQQQRAMDALLAWFGDNEGNAIVDAAVGSGKSVMLAWLCQYAISNWPETRIIMLVPNKELLEQNLEKLLEIWPAAPVGIMSASVGRKQIGYQITIATIGTIHRRAHELGNTHLLFVDECHLIQSADAGMYRDFIASLLKYCPDMRTIGWTGTPFRGNGVWLTASDTPLFHDIAARITMDELLAENYLAPLTTTPTVTTLDATGVKTVGGDYVASDLARAIDKPELIAAACAEAVILAADRNKWLVYCVTVMHAEHVTAEFQRLGVSCGLVTGETPKGDRAARISAFRRGDLRALVSVAVLTTGFNVPDVDCIVLLRNTQSPVLYCQIMGRAMRTAPGKTDALVLDFTDTVERLGPVNKVKGKLPKKSKGEAPVKVCEECGSINHISAKVCKTCGAEFEIIETPPHRKVASNALVLDTGKPIVHEYNITNVTYTIHRKPDSPDSLKVSYWSGMRIVANEWVCLNHTGFARSKAESWWMKRAPYMGERYAPSVGEACLSLDSGLKLKQPSSIRVDESGKYSNIISYDFVKQPEETTA